MQYVIHTMRLVSSFTYNKYIESEKSEPIASLDHIAGVNLKNILIYYQHQCLKFNFESIIK